MLRTVGLCVIVISGVGCGFAMSNELGRRKKMMEMIEKTGDSFGTIFRESAGKCLDLDCLLQEERDRFYSLGDQLGYLGLDMQLKQRDLMEKETEYAIRELRKDFCEKRKLYRSMGILGGIFVAVFFW